MSEEEALRRFVERARRRLGESPELAERSVQLKIVEPFLGALGWDVRSRDVKAAWPDGGDHGVDYVLLVDGNPVIAVEVLGTGMATDEDVARGFAQRLDTHGIEWGILSNGRRFVFLAQHHGTWKRRCGGLAELLEMETVLEKYTRDRAKDRRANRDRLASRLLDARSSLIDDVTDRFEAAAGNDAHDELRTAATRAVDEAIETLRTEEPVSTSGGTTGDPRASAIGEDAESSDTLSRVEQTNRTERDDDHGGVGNGHGDKHERDELPPDDKHGRDEPPPDDKHGRDELPPDDKHERVEDDRHTDHSDNEPLHESHRTEANRTPVEGSDGAGNEPSSSSRTRREGRSRAQQPSSDTGATEPLDGGSEDPGRPVDGTEDDAGTNGDEYVIRFFGGSTSVGAVGNPTPEGTLVGAFSYLAEHRALTNRIDVPWGVDDGTAIVARRPVHPDGTQMESVRELGDYYVWTGASAEECRRAIESMAELSGLRVMFQGDW